MIPSVRNTREFAHIAADVNYWRAAVHMALATAAGEPGTITLFGQGFEHELFAQHVANAETWVEVRGIGRVVREWSLKPSNSTLPARLHGRLRRRRKHAARQIGNFSWWSIAFRPLTRSPSADQSPLTPGSCSGLAIARHAVIGRAKASRTVARHAAASRAVFDNTAGVCDVVAAGTSPANQSFGFGQGVDLGKPRTKGTTDDALSCLGTGSLDPQSLPGTGFAEFLPFYQWASDGDLMTGRIGVAGWDGEKWNRGLFIGEKPEEPSQPPAYLWWLNNLIGLGVTLGLPGIGPVIGPLIGLSDNWLPGVLDQRSLCG